MENTRQIEDKEKLVKLLTDFPTAYHKYVSDSIDKANNARSDEEFDRIVNARLSEAQFFVEYMLNNGLTFDRTGYWICGDDDQDSWTCSECGFPVMAADSECDPYEAEIDYCEKCGAKMIKPKKV